MIDVRTGPSLSGAMTEHGPADALVVPVFEGLVWGPGADTVVATIGDWVEGYLTSRGFTAKVGETAAIPAGELGYDEVVFIGLGTEADAEGLRRAAGYAARTTISHATVATTLNQVEVDSAADLVAFGFSAALYRFGRYVSADSPVKTTALLLLGEDADDETTAEHGTVLAAAVAHARDLVNEPARGKSPRTLASWAMDNLGPVGVRVEIWDEERIIAERLGGLEAVALGSDEPARLVTLHHSPPGATRTVVFVGKGIVFDSGGLSLKSGSGMETMKTDMSGAAAVFAAVWAVAKLKLPVEVVGITPLTENMPGPSAFRPGDIFTARNGKTVEVLNTDAEGRMVLADGLSLATEMKPDLIVDVATLTGACKVALGEEIAGFFASDDATAAVIDGAAAKAGESLWRLPLATDYRKKLDTPIADMKNVGGPFGGAITAALFLKEFVDETPWAHLDIAGPARTTADLHYISTGGTGFGVRTLVAIAEAMEEEGT